MIISREKYIYNRVERVPSEMIKIVNECTDDKLVNFWVTFVTFDDDSDSDKNNEVNELKIGKTNQFNALSYLGAAQSSDQPFKVTEGSSVVLACHYSVRHHGISHVCWGRDCGTFWCHDILAQTDDNGVISKISERYRIIGDILSGQMDLGIQKIQQTDSGSYCCRVDIDGLFNDKKVSYTLRVSKGKCIQAKPSLKYTLSVLNFYKEATQIKHNMEPFRSEYSLSKYIL